MRWVCNDLQSDVVDSMDSSNARKKKKEGDEKRVNPQHVLRQSNV